MIKLDYILSNNNINEFLIYDWEFKEEDIVVYYVNYLKSLALKIHEYPIELFYNYRFNYFPILT